MKKEVRTAKSEFWDRSLQTPNCSDIYGRLKAMKGPAETKVIGNIQGETRFQGKCDRLRAIPFHVNRTTTEIHPSIIPHPLQDIVDSVTPVTPEEVGHALQGTRKNSTPGADNIPWSKVADTQTASQSRWQKSFPPSSATASTQQSEKRLSASSSRNLVREKKMKQRATA